MSTPVASIITTALQAASIVVNGVSGPYAAEGADTGTSSWHTKGGQWIRVDWPSAPTAPQIAAADVVIQATTWQARIPRTMFAIAADIFALPGVLGPPATLKKLAVITDLFTGSVAAGAQKWQQDAGPNAASLSAVYASVTAANGLSTFNVPQQLIMAAMYVQDNPRYLVNPVFDVTINIPGDQVAP